MPICPVQAKYNALKTLSQAKEENLDIRTQCVVSRVLLDDDGNVNGIEYKRYQLNDSITYETYVVTGKIYVLAASAFENAKILLSSPIVPNKISKVTGKPYTVGNQSDQVGRNIMDHLCLLTWGLLPEKDIPLGVQVLLPILQHLEMVISGKSMLRGFVLLIIGAGDGRFFHQALIWLHH